MKGIERKKVEMSESKAVSEAMMQTACAADAWERSSQVIGCGDFVYRADFTWAKWPEELEGVHVLNGGFDREGNLFAATDRPEHPIVRFDGEGNYLGSIGAGLFKKAHSAFVTPQNTILAADSSDSMHVIREITRQGELVRDYGTLHQPGDSGYDKNYLEVLKNENRIPEDPLWNLRAAANARLDSIRRRGMPFCRPCMMEINSKGEYFAADGYGNAAVHKFAEDGSYLFSFGEPGTAPGQFRLVHGLCIDPQDRIWVADRENSRVQVFTGEGELLAVIGGLMRIGGVWTDGTYVYIGELDGGIAIADMNFVLTARFGYEGSPIHAHGLTGDSRGNLYVFTNKKNRNNILRLTRGRWIEAV